MKRLFALLPILMAVLWTTTALAQYDDLYYDPDKDAGYYSNQPANNSQDPGYNNYGNDDYYDDDYGYEDDYDYYYSSRIRRFHRPYSGFGYFDPCYVDMSYYDPFFTPGITMLIYDNPWSWNRWNRYQRWNYWNDWYSWNRWNHWGPSFTYIQVYNSWGNPWGFNSWNSWGGYNPWGWNSWGWNNYNVYNNYYYPPSWGDGNVYNTPTNINNVVYGPRKSGTVKTERTSVRLNQQDDTGGRVTPKPGEQQQPVSPPRQEPTVRERQPVETAPAPQRDRVQPAPPRTEPQRDRVQPAPVPTPPRTTPQPQRQREQPPAPPRTEPQKRDDNRNNNRYNEGPRTQPQPQPERQRQSAPPSYTPPRNSNPQPRNYEAPRSNSNNNAPSRSYSNPGSSNNNRSSSGGGSAPSRSNSNSSNNNNNSSRRGN